MFKSTTVKFVKNYLSLQGPIVSTATLALRNRNVRKRASEKPEVGLICHAFEDKSACAATTFSLESVDGI
jgi:hypothetical protein